MSDLTGRRYLVFGVASDESLAWAAARELAACGATVALGYQQRYLSRVRQLVKDAPFVEAWEECDVASDPSVARFFTRVAGAFDGLVHAVAFAPEGALRRPVVEVAEEDFASTLSVSAYSLVRLLRHALPRLSPGAAAVTLTYLGSERVVPGYRLMGPAKAALEALVRELAAGLGPLGHRVNAVSPGPVRTLAARGVPLFEELAAHAAANAPLLRGVHPAEVARTIRFLLSPDASGITGQTIRVDAGYSISAMPLSMTRLLRPVEAEAE